MSKVGVGHSGGSENISQKDAEVKANLEQALQAAEGSRPPEHSQESQRPPEHNTGANGTYGEGGIGNPARPGLGWVDPDTAGGDDGGNDPFDENKDMHDTGPANGQTTHIDLIRGGTTHGTAGHDIIDDPHNDTDDVVYGGSGVDIIKTGKGNDRIYGGNDADGLYGGGGNDQIFGNRGDDYLNGGDGNDIMWAGSGKDNVEGGAGDDFIRGGSGDDTLVGGFGTDNIHGGTGDDLIHASHRNLWSNAIDNTVAHGGEGNDTLYGVGTQGNVTLIGGDGNDTITSISQDASELDHPDYIGTGAGNILIPGRGQDIMNVWGGEIVKYGNYNQSKDHAPDTINMNGPELNLTFHSSPSQWHGIDPNTFEWADSLSGVPGQMVMVELDNNTEQLQIDLTGDGQPDFALNIRHNGHAIGDQWQRPNINIESFYDPSNSPG